jgi:hypothetical protein
LISLSTLKKSSVAVARYGLGVDKSGWPKDVVSFAKPGRYSAQLSAPLNREAAMRDIQSDLQERATVIDEQIRTAYARFEKAIQQLQSDRDAKISELKSDLAIISKFIELEKRYSGDQSPDVRPPLVLLADLFLRKLKESGPMSKDDLIDLALKEGYFSSAEKALQGVHPMLVNMLRGEQIRELTNGNFSLPTLSQAVESAPPTFSQVVKIRGSMQG